MPVVEGREPQALQVGHQKEVQVFLREKQELLMVEGECFQQEVEPVLEKRLHSQKMPREGRSRSLS